jgi:hypothetical protein
MRALFGYAGISEGHVELDACETLAESCGKSKQHWCHGQSIRRHSTAEDTAIMWRPFHVEPRKALELCHCGCTRNGQVMRAYRNREHHMKFSAWLGRPCKTCLEFWPGCYCSAQPLSCICAI